MTPSHLAYLPRGSPKKKVAARLWNLPPLRVFAYRANFEREMKEDFLHFLWRAHRFNLDDLRTTQGEPLEILHWGAYNRHAGPDFQQARLRIGDTLWAGNVEMHLRASEWMRHRHQDDDAYRNVVLHVVLEEDEPVWRPNGERLPCLELKSRIPPKLSGAYLKLLHNEHWIPCQHLFYTVPDITRRLWMDRLAVERIEQRTQAIATIWGATQNNWEETFYRLLARSFGAKVNMEPFEQLARSTPLLLLSKYKNNLFRLEALLFGQAGLLEKEFEDEYPRKLQREYRFLQQKHQLAPMQGAQWKFLRMRPAAFPTMRIAQLAALVFQSEHLFSKILAAKDVTEVENMFAVKLSNYWQNHYVFDKESAPRTKTLGRDAVHLLLINTIVPVLFFFGKQRGETQYQDKALTLLETVEPESNHIIENWKKLGLKPESAYETQALLQLKQYYCDAKRCLECAIGSAILK